MNPREFDPSNFTLPQQTLDMYVSSGYNPLYTFVYWKPVNWLFGKSEDPDEMPQNVAYHQPSESLCCVL